MMMMMMMIDDEDDASAAVHIWHETRARKDKDRIIGENSSSDDDSSVKILFEIIIHDDNDK